MKVCKLLLAIASASVLLGVLAMAASARRLEVSSSTIRETFRELRFASELGSLSCPVTLEGSLHSRTIAKVAATLIGYITRARLGFCQIGTATILTETLPWHVRYASFAGTLPNITSYVTNIVGFTLKYRDLNFGLICRPRSTEAEPLIGTYRVSTGLISGERISGTLPTTFEECTSTRFRFSSDEGIVAVLGATTTVSIRLI